MSTNILYHGFGVVGYRYKCTSYQEGAMIFTIEKDRTSLRCLCCKSGTVARRGSLPRWFRIVPIGSKRVYIKLQVPRVFCRICCIIRQINLGFADDRRTYTLAFERYALELSRHMTIKDVADHLGVSWGVVKDIHKRYLTRKFVRLPLKHLELIAIDEISVGKNHRYLTVVLDLITGSVVYIDDGKGADALFPFWRKLKGSGASVAAVAMDMSPALIASVTEHLPTATIVFDYFHLIKLFSGKLAALRRDLQREAQQAGKHVLKGTRWLLLKHPESLRAERNEQQRLHEALSLNESLATANYLKDDLRSLWLQPCKQQASSFLDDWLARAKVSNIKMLSSLADTLERHRDGILAYYDYPISTGPLEGTNNKIKTLQRQAFGFRDMQFFKLKIFGLHETKYALVG